MTRATRFQALAERSFWGKMLATCLLLVSFPVLLHPQGTKDASPGWAQCYCNGQYHSVQLSGGMTCQSLCTGSGAPAGATSSNNGPSPADVEREKREHHLQEEEQALEKQQQQRKRHLAEDEQDIHQRHQQRKQHLAEEEQAQEEHKAANAAAAIQQEEEFARKKQQSVQQLRLPGDSGGDIHDGKPVALGQRGEDRNTGIKKSVHHSAGPVIRDHPSQEAASASAAGQAGKSQGAEAATSSASEVFDKPGPRAPSSEVDFSRRPAAKKLPPGITNNPKYKQLDSERRNLAGQHQSLEQELAQVRAEKQKKGASKGALDLREVEIKDKLGRVEKSQTANQTALEDFTVKWESTPEPKAGSETKPERKDGLK
jgi:hypothetical protein